MPGHKLSEHQIHLKKLFASHLPYKQSLSNVNMKNLYYQYVINDNIEPSTICLKKLDRQQHGKKICDTGDTDNSRPTTGWRGGNLFFRPVEKVARERITTKS